jgi:hypothetical protein
MGAIGVGVLERLCVSGEGEPPKLLLSGEAEGVDSCAAIIFAQGLVGLAV